MRNAECDKICFKADDFGKGDIGELLYKQRDPT